MLSKPYKGLHRKMKFCKLTNIDTRNSIMQILMALWYFPNVGERGCPPHNASFSCLKTALVFTRVCFFNFNQFRMFSQVLSDCSMFSDQVPRHHPIFFCQLVSHPGSSDVQLHEIQTSFVLFYFISSSWV